MAHKTTGTSRPPWVLISGGFHRRGGMDKANAALAVYLAECGFPVHLVTHDTDPEIASIEHVAIHRVPKPLGSFLLGRRLLAIKGQAIARKCITQNLRTRVVVNGTICDWSDVNWVHFVHQVYRPCLQSAPPLFGIKSALDHRSSRRREWTILRRARVLLANSEGTRMNLINALQIEPDRVRTIYLGSDDCMTATSEKRVAARLRIGRDVARPLIAFVGALGHDANKGFDSLWQSWSSLSVRSDWDADLVVAGGGRALGKWRTIALNSGLDKRVSLLGFTRNIEEVYSAADLLVSPSRYDSYGLNVHEALCRGVPAMVTASAGVAERYASDMQELLIPDPDDTGDLAARLLRWRGDMDRWKRIVAPVAEHLRQHTWREMAHEIVETVAGCSPLAAEN